MASQFKLDERIDMEEYVASRCGWTPPKASGKLAEDKTYTDEGSEETLKFGSDGGEEETVVKKLDYVKKVDPPIEEEQKQQKEKEKKRKNCHKKKAEAHQDHGKDPEEQTTPPPKEACSSTNWTPPKLRRMNAVVKERK